MSSRATVTCPQCGADVTLEAHSEYQGVRPHGGYVTYTEPIDRACTCEWSDADWTEMHEQATRQHDRRARNFSNEELY